MPPKPNIRKRQRSDSSGSEDGAGAVNIAAIRELREEQKFRSRAAGVDADKLLAAAQEAADAAKAGAEKPIDAAAQAAEELRQLTSVGSGGLENFQSGGKALIDPLEAVKQEFIQKRLREMRGEKDTPKQAPSPRVQADPWEQGSAAGSDRADEVDPEALLSNPDLMYELPAHLRPKAKVVTGTGDRAGGSGGGNEDSTGTGGVMLMGTGITEVALPLEHKARNIAETEKAMMDYLAKKRQRGADGTGPDAAGAAAGVGASNGHSRGAGAGQGRMERDGQADSSLGPGSFTANYAHHRREYAAASRGPGPQPQGTGASRPKEARADTALFDSRPVPAALRNNGASGAAGEASAGAVSTSAGASGQGAPGDRGAGAAAPGQDRSHWTLHASDDALFAKHRARELAGMRNR